MKKISKIKLSVDKVRASRDGHEYHEAWTARRAMQLLWPESDLSAIAIEGLSSADQRHASADASEIADITLYYGAPVFEHAARTTIAQFKYSIANSAVEFRAAQAKKTITKFVKAYKDFRRRYGKGPIDKLDFELITNRPIYPPLLEAIEALAKGLPRKGEISRQADQLQAASGLSGKSLAEFAGKCAFLGRMGNLTYTKNELAALVVDWSATNDPPAVARLGQLRQMVRDKAGSAGTNQNLIRRTDILAALDVGDEDELLPCKSALVDVGEVVEREQFDDALALLRGLSEPLLIHATGGVGKTVFMTSLARALEVQSEVVFFDCFGGGAYRSPEDSRHLPKRGLIHIANTLAFRGLCDPILPGSTDVQALLNTFRRRLVQCVDTLSRTTPGRGLTLFLDAIDNAALVAQERDEEAFPILILEVLHHKPVTGVTLIVSSRTERRPSTYARHREFKLLPFNTTEAGIYLRSRLKTVSQTEVKVAQARSGGNPRVLEYLVNNGRGVLDQSEINKEVALDDLIQQRITDALSTAVERGHAQEDINTFLAGLAVLPPPVPLDEYAGAHGFDLSAIESFASDLSPLLERTGQGLMFRDEPTETLVRKRYAPSLDSLRKVAANLLKRQDTSVYAARALPGLLHTLDDGEQLFQLAFDDRIPASITSTVGKRNVRYARIKAAVLHAAIKRDFNRLVQLLVELSSIAAVDQRGVNYILDYPDLVVAAQDVDAARRLFETRTGWPGARHARLAIAQSLAGQSEEASRHAMKAQEWIEHFFRREERDNGRNDPSPEQPDIAAIPFFLLCEGKAQEAAEYLRNWQGWWAYEVSNYVVQYFQLAAFTRPLLCRTFAQFVDSIDTIGPLVSVLAFDGLPEDTTRKLITKLDRLCKRAKKLPLADRFLKFRHKGTNDLQYGVQYAAALALSLGLNSEALTISRRLTVRRVSLWSLRDQSFFQVDEVFSFIAYSAVLSAAQKRPLHEKDIVPPELVPICSRLRNNITGKFFGDKIKAILPKFTRNERDAGKPKPDTLSYDQMRLAEQFVDYQMQPLLELTRGFADFLSAPLHRVDKTFIALLKTWGDVRKNRDPYLGQGLSNLFRLLGLETALFALQVRRELTPASVERFLTMVHSQEIGPATLVQIVSILAQRPPLHELAGQQAMRARSLIEVEDDVASRASLLGDLGRAMLPASIADASVYFRDGLEQMDAIGSGDSEFTNELVIFASTMKGNELAESDFHTLTNICELNMGEDPEKFFWGAFAGGVSKAAGARGLAKLSRWDDRSKVDLEHTLLPYLTALVESGKIETEIALCLNRLARPVEYWHHGTKEFAEAIRKKVGVARPDIISELIHQYEDDRHGLFSDWTVKPLAELAEGAFGRFSETTAYLAAAQRRFPELGESCNRHVNYKGSSDDVLVKKVDDAREQERATLQGIVKATNPTDRNSLADAIKEVGALRYAYDLKVEFFSSIRRKVPFGGRAEYIRHICAIEHLNLYWKLEELNVCKSRWLSSSAALGEIFRDQSKRLVRTHMEDLVSDRRLSGHHLHQISELTGVPGSTLVLEIITTFARPETSVSGAIWLAIASFIGAEADDGQGQLALTRLLRSDAAKLANTVIDGESRKGLYPEDDVEVIAAGLVWRMLGSPYAAGRWRAAHSLRSFARFGRWKVVDALVSKINSEETAGPFQASELTFYFLHARLWMLITLARIALDYPIEVARYKDSLLKFAMEESKPHVLMRHFAARALLTCIDSGHLELPDEAITHLRVVDLSPHERLRKKVRCGGGFYQGRPPSAKKSKFHLDHDFNKDDVDYLAQVFGKSLWKVEDIMGEVVHQLAPTVKSMYETGGGVAGSRSSSRCMSMEYHTYGQQLGWHALFFAAGRLLRDSPVTNDWWHEDDPWGYWLSRFLLTRQDGLWLSDGMDRLPLDTATILLETDKNEVVLTGDRDKLLQLAGIDSRVGKQLVVDGMWYSVDGIRIRISSALVAPSKAQRLARRLIREDPMRAWLPVYDTGDESDECLRFNRKNEYAPWIVRQSGEARLDEHDPLGDHDANLRSRIGREYLSAFSLTTTDPFGRTWHDRHNRVVLRAQAWAHDKVREDGSGSGLRLLCSTAFLKSLLRSFKSNLLLLVSLERYEGRDFKVGSKFTHTIAVVRVTESLDFEFYGGRVNYVHESRWR